MDRRAFLLLLASLVPATALPPTDKGKWVGGEERGDYLQMASEVGLNDAPFTVTGWHKVELTDEWQYFTFRCTPAVALDVGGEYFALVGVHSPALSDEQIAAVFERQRPFFHN